MIYILYIYTLILAHTTPKICCSYVRLFPIARKEPSDTDTCRDSTRPRSGRRNGATGLMQVRVPPVSVPRPTRSPIRTRFSLTAPCFASAERRGVLCAFFLFIYLCNNEISFFFCTWVFIACIK